MSSTAKPHAGAIVAHTCCTISRIETVSSGVARGKALGLTASDIGAVEGKMSKRCSGLAFTALEVQQVHAAVSSGAHVALASP